MLCRAIAGQYETVSETRAALALALADRLDSLLGLFAAGLAPKGSNDPFALRRAAIHIIENLAANNQAFDLRQGLLATVPLLPIPADETTVEKVLQFISGRLAVVLRERGIVTSVIKAILAELGHDPFTAIQTAVDLQEVTGEDGWQELLNAYARCVRITRNLETSHDLRPDDFKLDAELDLLTAYRNAFYRI